MKKYQIKTPCAEKWESMTPTEKGRFCDKCQLEVVDLTNGQEVDLTQGRVCGRIAVPVQKKVTVSARKYVNYKRAAVLIPLLGSMLNANPISAQASEWINPWPQQEKVTWAFNQNEEIVISGTLKDKETGRSHSFWNHPNPE